MSYQLAKALHIIGFVSWFAGLFYIVRLYVYDVEANQRDAAAREVLHPQLRLMQRRLWHVITWPAMVLTLVGGLSMVVTLVRQDLFANQGWLHIKLVLVAALVGYHLQCGRIRKQLAAGTFRWSGQRMRMWNELPTVLLVAIVFDAVYRTTEHLLYGVLGMVILAVVLMIAVRLYRRARTGA
ncbi:CopD family protein [Haliangium sp.]|uniref:CopD family protein n=1 Tax=Haliangium sp. TaxID=2663208 RepID=UPI003D0CA618